jgi:hypothetical protein
VEYNLAIMAGLNPIVEMTKDGSRVVVQDPSPNAQPPTIEQKNAAVRWLADRRDGMVPQKIDLQATVQPELSPAMLDALSRGGLLYGLAELLGVTAPRNIIDAEFTELQEAGQLVENDISDELPSLEPD